MNEQMKTSRSFSETSIQSLIKVILNKAWLVALVSITAAALVCGITAFYVAPKYESSAMFYINNNAISIGGAASSISSSDLTTSRRLVESYIVILNTRETLEAVIDTAGVDRSYVELKQMITADSVEETEIIQVKVTGTDPVETEKIADAITVVLPERIDGIIERSSSKIIETAVLPSQKSSPSLAKNTFMGILLGFSLVVGILAGKKVFDITIRREEDVLQISAYPVLASVPNMEGGSNRRKNGTGATRVTSDFIGDDIPAAAAEAYKLLRTKLQFSFGDDDLCHVIGVSSALSGEGKSTTSINLAYSMAQLNKKVLLVDCDLRRPSVAAKLKLQQGQGLSAYLTRQCDANEIMQEYPTKEGTFSVIPAGKIPPNPMELLNSSQMEQLVVQLSKRFEYIIFDLPPVMEVGDALAVAKLIDGMLLTVRQDYCNSLALEDTIHRFEFVKSKVLGILMTCATAPRNKKSENDLQ